MRTAARRSGTYSSRSFLALAAFLIVGCMLLGLSDSVHPTRLSRNIFEALTFTAFVAVVLVGMFLTADCLSAEKREGTLGLLFLTDLKGWDVVLGKLAGTSLLGIFGFLAVLPMLALPVMFGAVSGRQFCQVSIALGAIMALSLSTGLLFSAVWRQSHHVVGATFFMAVIMAVGLELPSRMLKYWFPMSSVYSMVRLPSSYALLEQAMSPISVPRSLHLSLYSWSLVAHLGLAALAFAGACWFLPRRWKESSLTTKTTDAPRSQPAFTGRKFGIKAMSPRLGDRMNPFCWLTLRTSGRDSWGWLLLTIGGVSFLALYGFGILTNNNGYFGVATFVAFGLHFVFKVLLTLSMVRRLNEDRGSGALELLLSTPMDPKTLLLGHRAALRAQWKWAIGGLFTVNWLLLAAILGSSLFNHSAYLVFSQIIVGGAILLLLDVVVIEVVGPWMALKHQKPARAAWATLARVMGPGFVGLFALVLCTNGGSETRLRLLHLIWLFFNITVGVNLRNAAKQRLTQSFRDYVAGLIPEKS